MNCADWNRQCCVSIHTQIKSPDGVFAIINPQLLLLFPALLLLLTMVLGLLRALQGPSLQDRMLSVLLLGTGGAGLLLLLSFILEQPALIDVALVLALLAAMTAAALTRRETDDD